MRDIEIRKRYPGGPSGVNALDFINFIVTSGCAKVGRLEAYIEKPSVTDSEDNAALDLAYDFSIFAHFY